MQFELLLNEALKSNKQYQQLTQKLVEKEEKCLKNAITELQQNKCRSKRNNFEEYFQQYTTQFKEKGRAMCCNAMKQHRDLDQKIRLKQQCITFYAKSIPLFEENAIDKLKSLAKNTDFSEL